ncbi:RNA polymerase sigma-70 factor (ECF subfamily) [Arcanobacterium wilhelmae]|uniref:RNA polymerase sigma-70 factor (ECF subfamily) n=1 Tax=Arcanobacterium wilhelmae TaxID=1803177 RepID=A0ABT9NA23_9ACTO|nr:sigma-70 family RNA polymerase sigma factor [Arcanobacterium wilhelmae]MDP9800569.1 RNA polymerase sigma-70 factor (ECF subfamily) [Arcanobacterium wilhelmae]WFN89983.1 sigma-70 family RNA polymerase sigma factor [Arcanobacterium wilhelmae]
MITDIDSVLLVKVARGDREAFARIYDTWSGRIFSLICSIVVDRAQSEEVLQEVFLEVWQRSGAFDPAKGSARAYLVTLARRRAIDRVRASQAARDRDAAQPVEREFDETLAEVEERIVAQDVRTALAKIGEPHKSTVELAFLTGYTHAQIADLQQVPLGTVKSRIRDGLAKMKSILEGER